MSSASDSNNKKYLVSVVGCERLILMEIMDERTQQFYKKIDVSSVKKMFTFLLSLKDDIKAVFLSVSSLETSEYQNNFEASKAIKNFLDHHSIPCHFYSAEYLLCFKKWIAANITSNVNDLVLSVNVGNDENYLLTVNTFAVNGYKTLAGRSTEGKSMEEISRIFCGLMQQEIVKKMVLFATDKISDASLKTLETALRSNKSYDVGSKLIVLNSEKVLAIGTSGKSIIEMGKWFFDRSYVKFYFPQVVPKTIDILCVTGNSRKKIIIAERNSDIPFDESMVISKTVQQCLIERIIIPEIKELPNKLDQICDMKIPVIGFFDSSAVICVYKNDGYGFLGSWNGMYGNDLIINFEAKEAKFGIEAIKADKTKMISVVYDFIKIMSMPFDKIVVKEEWKFVITKNSENPLLIEFVNYEGRKQAGTPSFLMAMLLKEMLKRIKNEMNEEKSKEIGFCFFDKFTFAEKKRVENGLKEACELL
uniref:Uncharacterized protein n=1 Tax=Panagrolaimus davidi TaxID=227884 RepID=A0A914QE64_9BILA